MTDLSHLPDHQIEILDSNPAPTGPEMPATPILLSHKSSKSITGPYFSNVFNTIPPSDEPTSKEKTQEPPPKVSPKSSVEKTNILSLLHFFFVVNFIKKVNSLKNRVLNLADLDPIGPSERSEDIEKLFTCKFKEWVQKDPNKRSSLEITLVKIFWKDYAAQFFWQIVQGATRLMVAFFLYHMLIDIRSTPSRPRDAYVPGIGLFLCNLGAFYALHQAGFNVTYCANKVRAGILTMLYKKITKLSPTAVHNMNLGKVINLIANDTNSLERAHILSLVTAPLIFLGGFGLLFYFWGVSCLVGLGYMALTWIIQAREPLGSLAFKFEGKTETEQRIGYLNSTIDAIRTIKLFGWEFKVIEKIEKSRAKEIAGYKKGTFFDCIPRAILYTSHWVAGFLIYLTYTQVKGPILTSLTFPTAIILGVLRQFCMLQFFSVITFYIEMKSLGARVAGIMNLPEVEPPVIITPISPENSIEFTGFTGYWMKRDMDVPPPPKVPKLKFKYFKLKGFPVVKPPADTKIPIDLYHPALSKIDLQIKKGSFVVVIGKLGAGKSSLLQSLTGQLAYYEGELRYRGTYVHVGQRPLLGQATIKEIILSEKEYDERKWKRIIKACDLSYDLENMPEGENTNVGERGVVLNEMQRAKIVLARAIYLDVDIYLLDEPFAFMSSNSARHVYHHAVRKLLKGKTTIMATHKWFVLRHADQILVMNNGEISARGTFDELEEQNVDLDAVMGLEGEDKVDVEHVTDHTIKKYRKILEEVNEEEVFSEETQCFVASRQDEGLVIEEEKLDDGKVHRGTYLCYFKTLLNWWTFIPFGALFVGGEMFAWLYLYFLGKWAKGLWSDSLAYEVLGPVVFGSILFHFVKYVVYFNTTYNTSEKLHNKMLRSVFHSPIRFFEKNPLGRILSRFSNDISILDRNVTASLLEVLEGFCLFWVYVFALWITSPWILVSAAVALFFGLIIGLWCRKAVYQTRGLELITRAPLYSSFSYAIDSLISIRLRQLSEVLIKKFYTRADDYSRANIAYMSTLRFLRFWIDYVTELTVIVTLCIFITAESQELAIGYFFNILISLPATLSWILRGFLTLHLNMASVARITTYVQNAKSIDLVKPNDRYYLKGNWPRRGDIEIRNATLRYSPKSDPFLRDISLNIQHGEKIAVVGSTRSGMSTLLAMLVRIFDIDREPGSYIKVGGVDIRDVGIQVLRRPMVIIPQEAMVIPGTIRSNIDPWGEYSDDQIWEVLELVGLKEFIEDLPHKLETYLSRSSFVFSLGQRQLLCICRALLKKSALVIQDDATTNVDIPTSQALQTKILERYKDSTVLTMTHRVLTVALYDKVVIAHKGEIQEFGEPYLLLVEKIGDTEVTNKQSHMASMTRNLGKTLSRLVVKIAMRTYYKKHQIVLPSKGAGVRSSLNLDNIAADKIRIERANLVVGSNDGGVVRRKSSIVLEVEDEHMENNRRRFDALNKDPIRPFNKFDPDSYGQDDDPK